MNNFLVRIIYRPYETLANLYTFFSANIQVLRVRPFRAISLS